MKLRLHTRFFQYQSRESWLKVCGTQLDRAMAPIGTSCVVLGLVAAFLGFNKSADYLIAAGLLLHLVIWFDGWLGTGKGRTK
jgi:hypothetical protein